MSDFDFDTQPVRSDSPQAKRDILNDEFVAHYLKEGIANAQDKRWLERHADLLTQAIKPGLQIPSLRRKALAALFLIAPVAVYRQPTAVWRDVIWEAIISAMEMGDELFTERVYALFGESTIAAADYAAARWAFSKDIERLTHIMSNWSDDYYKRWLLLALIGHFKTETYQQSAEYTDELADRALALAYEVDDEELVALLHQTLAYVHMHRKDNIIALMHGLLALNYWREQQSPVHIARTSVTLSAICQAENQHKAARDFIHLAVNNAAQTSNLATRATVNYQQGAIAFDDARYNDAIRYFKRAYAGFRELGWVHQGYMTLHALALVYICVHRYRKARALLKLALSGWKQLRNDFQRANCYYALAFLAARIRQPDSAIRYSLAGFALCKRLPNTPAVRELRDLFQEFLADLRYGDYASCLPAAPDDSLPVAPAASTG